MKFRQRTLYLHVFNWPADGKLVLPGLKNPVTKAWLLSDRKEKSLQVSSAEGNALVNVPVECPDRISATVVVKVKGTPDVTGLP